MKLFPSSVRLDRKMAVLLLLILVEAVLGAHFWARTEYRVPFGFLVKNGDLYILVWKAEDETYKTATYPSLRQAIDFAHRKLSLETGRNPVMSDEMEHVWMQDRQGAYVMFWKTLRLEYLNQLTFHRRADADYYMKAFREGSYTTSPFGHSIFLQSATLQ